MDNQLKERHLTDKTGNRFVSFSFNQEHGWLFVQWFGPQPDDQVRLGCQMMCELVRETGYSKILNDGRLVSGSWKTSNSWIENHIAQEIIEGGLRYFAHLVPDDLNARVSMVDLHHRIGDRTQMRVFMALEDAEAWLDSL